MIAELRGLVPFFVSVGVAMLAVFLLTQWFGV